MAYIGREPQIGNFQVCDAISVVNGQAAYTMQVSSVNVSPETANHMIVSLNGIIQAPGSSYTVSGSTITFASNLVTGDVINFIHILGSVLDLGTPSDSTVSLAKLTATGTKNSTTFLRGDNTFAEVGGGLDHIFSVKLASDQSLSGSTITKVAFATEEIDTDSAFASNKFTVPSGQAGKYFFSAFIVISSVDARQQQLYIYKNGSVVKAVHHYTDAGEYDDIYDLEISCVLDLSATDYIEVYAQTDGSSIALTDGEYSSFQGFKLA